MRGEKFYITTSIPYPNGKPHLGFALEIVQADVVARYNRIMGRDVFFLTGTDEHGLKVFRSAKKEGLGFQEYVDKNSAEFAKLKDVLNISFDYFIRTTDRERHWPGATKLWRENLKDIYMKEYEGLYCVGCEEFKTEKELVDGLCPEHFVKPELVKEKNYFFRLSGYKDRIKKLIEKNEVKIIPESRKKEVLNLLADSGDFSISRPKEKIAWGIPVPDDPTQIQYVWYDALANYISAVGYGTDEEKFNKWWPAELHCIGKGVLRFHAIYWLAMLLSARLPVPRSIFVHGYITVEGKKISKSLGNVISPEDVVRKYGVDPVRYFLLREIPSEEDGDFSEVKFEERYEGDLANGLGNFAARVLTLGEGLKEIKAGIEPERKVVSKIEATKTTVNKKIGEFKFHEALSAIWELIAFGDVYVNETAPWGIRDEKVKAKIVFDLLVILDNVAALLKPFLPEAAEKIEKCLEWRGGNLRIKKGEVLFPRPR